MIVQRVIVPGPIKAAAIKGPGPVWLKIFFTILNKKKLFLFLC
jgi:hypothetical protein